MEGIQLENPKNYIFAQNMDDNVIKTLSVLSLKTTEDKTFHVLIRFLLFALFLRYEK